MAEPTVPTSTVQSLAQEYQQCLIALEKAITAMADEHRPAYELAGCLLRSLGTGRAIRQIGEGKPDLEWLIAQREVIHQAFGAPGDWGYATALGQTLQRLYALDLRPFREVAGAPS